MDPVAARSAQMTILAVREADSLGHAFGVIAIFNLRLINAHLTDELSTDPGCVSRPSSGHVNRLT
jgi:hypothetical protein